MTVAASTTLYLGADEVAALVQRLGLSACIARIGQRIGHEFARWAAFDKRARIASHGTTGVIELMPIADADRFAVKYVNGHPRNTALGLPTVMAFGVLADMATGTPRLLCELTLATAIRTAATSALAAQHLARPDSRVMALIGNGAQAEFQALALRDALGIRALRLFDTDPAATAKLMRNLAGTGLVLEACASTAAAVRGADVVTTITADRSRAAILTPDLIEPGMHLNAVGGDCPGKTELHPDVLAHASVFVEYAPQTRIEGDIQQMPADFPVTELWQVLSAERPGRRCADEVTVFDSVGFALEDYAALTVLHDAARACGIGRPIALVAMPEDPKDLFGWLARSAPRRAAAGRGLPAPFTATC